MTGVIVTKINPPPIMAWQITTATAPDLVTALATIATVGYSGTVVCDPDPNNPPNSVWTMNITRPGYPTQTGYVNDWIVFDGETADVYTNAKFVTTFVGS